MLEVMSSSKSYVIVASVDGAAYFLPLFLSASRACPPQDPALFAACLVRRRSSSLAVPASTLAKAARYSSLVAMFTSFKVVYGTTGRAAPVDVHLSGVTLDGEATTYYSRLR